MLQNILQRYDVYKYPKGRLAFYPRNGQSVLGLLRQFEIHQETMLIDALEQHISGYENYRLPE